MQGEGMWQNRAVAIVTFGFDNDTGKTLVKLLRKMGIGKREIFDLRNDLRDPKQTESRVKFQVDGTHEWTQRAVYSQSKFPAVLRSCFSQVESLAAENRPIIVFRACKTGYHRADTVGRTERECLNRLEKIEPNGRRTRMFNAQHFPLCDVWAKDVESHLQLAIEWSTSPFTLTKGGASIPRESLYAFEACSTRRQAAENFDRIYNWVDSMVAFTTGLIAGGQPEEEREAEKRPIQVKASPLTARKAQKRAEANQRDKQAARSAESGVGSSGDRGSTGDQAAIEVEDSPRHGTHASEPPPRKFDQRLTAPPTQDTHASEAPPPTVDGRSSGVESAPETKAKSPPSRPPATRAPGVPYTDDATGVPHWATFERSATQWYQLLKNIGCDENAVAELFLLAQHSDQGYMSANSAISKVLKALSDGRPIHNPSAFLHTVVKTSRHNLDRDASWVGYGWSSSSCQR